MLLSLVFSAVLVNDSRVHSLQDHPAFRQQLTLISHTVFPPTQFITLPPSFQLQPRQNGRQVCQCGNLFFSALHPFCGFRFPPSLFGDKIRKASSEKGPNIQVCISTNHRQFWHTAFLGRQHLDQTLRLTCWICRISPRKENSHQHPEDPEEEDEDVKAEREAVKNAIAAPRQEEVRLSVVLLPFLYNSNKIVGLEKSHRD